MPFYFVLAIDSKISKDIDCDNYMQKSNCLANRNGGLRFVFIFFYYVVDAEVEGVTAYLGISNYRIVE